MPYPMAEAKTEIKAGQKFTPRPVNGTGHSASYNSRFADRIITVLRETPDARGRVLVLSENKKLNIKKHQLMSAERLLSREYRRLEEPAGAPTLSGPENPEC